MSNDKEQENLSAAALEYHEFPTPGKIAVVPTKGLTNQRDLALAYSPGVAAACNAIVADPAMASRLTSRANLVGVVTNGTAVLGLGNIGPLAGKPVMEGKGVLFKKFAGIDVFDIELAENDADKLIDMIAAMEPTFGGINLEDIKAPECFYIEAKLRERMKIPVFHDDQHGTAIVVGAAILNGLKLVGKKVEEVKLVTSGAGAAALACLDLLVNLGVKVENIWVTDIEGVVYEGRVKLMDAVKDRYAKKTAARTLNDIIEGADVFLGLSAGGVVKPAMVAKMAKNPLILALANPTPEITPEDVKSVRDDAIIATGRSDYPNQVNNVLCFPFIFRGALDAGATTITEQMKLAAVRAIAELAQAEASDVVAMAYGGESLAFGREYLIPRPFDPRLIVKIAPAVAQAAAESGVATRPIADFDAYRDRLNSFVYHSGFVMKPVFAAAKKAPRRVVYCEGEDERVLRAVQAVLDEGLAQPVLIGRPEVISKRIEKAGLRRGHGARRRGGESGFRPALQGTLAGLPRDHGTPGRDPRHRQAGIAFRLHADRHHAAAPRLRRCHAVRRGGPPRAAPQACRRRDRPAAGGAMLRRDEHAVAGKSHAVHVRHLRQPRPLGRAGGRDRPDGGQGSAPLRPRTQGGAALAFQLRQHSLGLGAEDGGGPCPDRAARPGAGSRWRNARRRRAVAGDPRAPVSRLPPQG
jgi:malate dehydrogenase (oxaloacetate-decarboxylating)(NADP+)